MAKYSTVRGQTANIFVVFLPDASSTTGGGKTGLTNASAALNISLRREKSAAMTTYTGTNIGSIVTLGTWVDPGTGKCNFKEIDAVNARGQYEVHFQDVLFNASDSSRKLTGEITGTGFADTPFEIELTGFDLQVGTSLVDVRFVNGVAVQQLGSLAGLQVVTVNPVGQGFVRIAKGASYKNAYGNPLDFPTPTGSSWPNDFTGWTNFLFTPTRVASNLNAGDASDAWTMSVPVVSGAGQKIRLELTSAQTVTLSLGNAAYSFRVTANPPSSVDTVVLLEGTMTVIP